MKRGRKSSIENQFIMGVVVGKTAGATEQLKEIFSLTESCRKHIDYLLVHDDDGQVLSLAPDQLKDTASGLKFVRTLLAGIREKASIAISSLEFKSTK